jgi:hypothetical protein
LAKKSVIIDRHRTSEANLTYRHGKKNRKQSYPGNPAKVLSTAIYSGLVALVQLATRRVTNQKEVKTLSTVINQIWREALAE